MPARGVNVRFLVVSDHAANVWRAIQTHVRRARCDAGQCSIVAKLGGAEFVPADGCEWGKVLEEEYRIAVARMDEALKTARGGPAQPTQGAKHHGQKSNQ